MANQGFGGTTYFPRYAKGFSRDLNTSQYGASRFIKTKKAARDDELEEEEVPGRLCWGAENKIPEAEISPETGFEIQDPSEQEEWTETRRESDEIRIENPEDEEDWVLVDRAKKLYYNKITREYKYKTNTSTTTSTDLSAYDEDTADSFSSGSASSTKKSKVSMTLSNGPSSA